MLSSALLGAFDVKEAGPSGPPSLASSSGQRAREYSAEEWEEQRDRFTQLYQTPGLPLSKIQILMKERYGFDATLRQYKRKIKLWSLERNIKSSDSLFMVAKEAQRSQEEGKKTKFTVNGREVTEAKFARIRRKLFRSTSSIASSWPPGPGTHYNRTPSNIRYCTPRSPPAQHQQRRPSQHAAIPHLPRHTHLIECFLCNSTTYGAESFILKSFQAHVRSSHPGHDVLRCLEGLPASLVPGAVRTNHQLPSNHCGYVHGIHRTWDDTNGEILRPVRLGKMCLVEDPVTGGPRRPYLTLTHADSCLTLRPDVRDEAADKHFDMDTALLALDNSNGETIGNEFGMNSFLMEGNGFGMVAGIDGTGGGWYGQEDAVGSDAFFAGWQGFENGETGLAGTGIADEWWEGEDYKTMWKGGGAIGGTGGSAGFGNEGIY